MNDNMNDIKRNRILSFRFNEAICLQSTLSLDSWMTGASPGTVTTHLSEAPSSVTRAWKLFVRRSVCCVNIRKPESTSIIFCNITIINMKISLYRDT